MLNRLHNFRLICTALNIALLLLMALIFLLNPNRPPFFWGGTLAAFVIAAYFMNRSIERYYINLPLLKLTDAMVRLADKDTAFRLDEAGDDESGTLTGSFNELADMLSSSLIELEKSRDYLRGILESSADIILTINPSGTILTINMGVTSVLGYRRRDVVGKPIDILLADPEDRKVAARRLKHSDNVVNYETQFLTKTGAPRDILLTLSKIRNSAGAVIGTICFSKDITNEKQLQKKLMQSERLAAIGEVFTGVQHSMKNMLNACKGGAYMVRLGLKKDNRKTMIEGWEMVEEGIKRLTEMSSDMLRFVKEWKARNEVVAVADILSDIYNVIHKSADNKGIDLTLEPPDRLPDLCGDSKMIHSAVMDIVSNAIDACLWKEYPEEEIPMVRLRARFDDTDNFIVIEIEDNGCGMTEEVKENIFAPFFSTKSKAGTGLGLAITSRMIDLHNGKIEVDSEPYKGTKFRILLPLGTNNLSKELNHGEESSRS